MICFMIRWSSCKIFMINIIIFSLFMCMFNTDAAYESEARGWLTRESAVKNYTIFKSTIAAHLGFKDSLMLQVCSSLLESDYRWFENTHLHAANSEHADTLERAVGLVKIDIDAILYVLCRKSLQSSNKAEELANTFRNGDEEVRKGAMICDAFARCVPEFKPYGVEEILDRVLDLKNNHKRLSNLKKRYVKEGLQRFSAALIHLLWEKDYSLSHSEPKAHTAICSIHKDHCPFLQQFLYHDQHQHPMQAELMPQCDPLMYSDVMSPACDPTPQPMTGFAVPQWYQRPFLQQLLSHDQHQHPVQAELMPQCDPLMQSVVMCPTGEYQYAQPFPFQQPMTGFAVPQCDPLTQSDVRYPACSSQLQRTDSENRLEHLKAYVWRGVAPNLDPDAPDYVGCAYAHRPVDILDELPKMLDRIGRRFQNIPATLVACAHNVHARLHAIKTSMDSMNNYLKAMLFAWAFVTELQGYQAFYNLGFFRYYGDNVYYLLLPCLTHLPQYIYALTECTNIENYGDCMRDSKIYHAHRCAHKVRSIDFFIETWESFRPDWWSIAGTPLAEHGNPMGRLLRHIFPNGDAPDAI